MSDTLWRKELALDNWYVEKFRTTTAQCIMINITEADGIPSINEIQVYEARITPDKNEERRPIFVIEWWVYIIVIVVILVIIIYIFRDHFAEWFERAKFWLKYRFVKAEKVKMQSDFLIKSGGGIFLKAELANL